MPGPDPCLICCSPILIPCMIIEECCKIYCCLICCCNYPETNEKIEKRDHLQVYPVVEVEPYENTNIFNNEEIKECS